MKDDDGPTLRCFMCNVMGREDIGKVEVAQWVEPGPPDGNGPPILYVASLCEDCRVVHWAGPYRGPVTKEGENA